VSFLKSLVAYWLGLKITWHKVGLMILLMSAGPALSLGAINTGLRHLGPEVRNLRLEWRTFRNDAFGPLDEGNLPVFGLPSAALEKLVDGCVVPTAAIP
jgi:hypothetical protein